MNPHKEIITRLLECLEAAAQDFPPYFFADDIQVGRDYLAQFPGEKMKIKPDTSFIMVRIRPRTEKIGSIHLAPNQSDDPADKKGDLPAIGEILAVGDGHLMEDGTLVPMRLRVGQFVLLNGRGGVPVYLPEEGITVWFMREKEILAVVEDLPPVQEGN